MVTKHAKKRKASELESGPTANGHSKKAKGKKSSKRESTPKPGPDDPPFNVVCPFEEQAGYKRGGRCDLARDFSFEYGVKSFKSDLVWDQIKSYKHVKLAEMSVTVGDIVYVLHTNSANPPPSDATDEEILAFDKKNCWVGKILQAKAASDREVFILVAWLYWPNEIPKQLKTDPQFYSKHYAPNELIMSNALQVIDANSISAKADVYDLDEENERELSNIPERFWRQTFNAGRYLEKPSESGVLSTLSNVCKCQSPIDPAEKMLRCSKEDCRAWNHERCIIDEIGNDLWAIYESEKMDQYAQDHAPEAKSIGQQIAGAFSAASQDVKDHMKHLIKDGVAAVAEETTTKLEPKSNPSTPARRGRPKKLHDVWKSALDIDIIFDDKLPPVARVMEKISNKRSWDLRVDCLVCGHTMD